MELIDCNYCTNSFNIDPSYREKFTYFMCNDCIGMEYRKYIGSDIWKNTDENRKKFMNEFFLNNQKTYCDSVYFRSLYNRIEYNLVKNLFDGLSAKKRKRKSKKSKSLKKRKSKKKSRRARV